MAALRYDVVVVGAGPAGSSAARAAVERGLSVLLVESRQEIGRPVQCAEYVTRMIGADVALPQSCVAQRTDSLRTFLPGGSSQLLSAPGFVLYRERFDKHLAAEAVRAGADIVPRARALRRTGAGLIVRVANQEREIEARVIVGADGVLSTVGRWIGQRNTELIIAAQYEMVIDRERTEDRLGLGGNGEGVGHNGRLSAKSMSPTCDPLIDPKRNGVETEVYFSPDYPGGYAWVFPKGRTANVGVGVDVKYALALTGPAGFPGEMDTVPHPAAGGHPSEEGLRSGRPQCRPGAGSSTTTILHQKLDMFVDCLRQTGRIETTGAVAFTGGYVPVGGLLKGWHQNILLAGDAAGCVHPLTGAGIFFAVVSGRLAGQIAAEAVRAGDLAALAAYEPRLREAIGGSIDRGLARRRRLLAGWTVDPAQLDSLLRETWIAFSGDETWRPNEG